jgi:hypothetical protein
MCTLSRNDRHVLHARLRVNAGAPRHKLQFNVEEALRLCSLPGENEGRVYYFRRLYLDGLPQDGDRQVWQDAFQRALLDLARGAIYGKHGDAQSAESVYFHSRQEACETLLALILRRRSTDAWFWAAVYGASTEVSLRIRPADHAEGVIETLSRSEASWFAVASAVFASGEPLSLLNLLFGDAVPRWLKNLNPHDRAALDSPPARLQGPALLAIEHAVTALGAEDPRVLWLAAMAVLHAEPSRLESGIEDGTVLSAARAALRTLHLSVTPQTARRIASSLTLTEPLNPAGRDSTNLARVRSRRASQSRHETRSEGRHDTSDRQLADTDRPRASESKTTAFEAHSEAFDEDLTVAEEPNPQVCFGEPTSGAGLYFFLNALKHLRIATRRTDPRMLAYFFRGIARSAGIEDSDPILLWVSVTLEENALLVPDEQTLRSWTQRARRWCWKNAAIGMSEIVRRPGLVTLTRTDLDVSLSIDSADIRIRRIGLDLDPGWLSWFGRVVRFHYAWRGEFHG